MEIDKHEMRAIFDIDDTLVKTGASHSTKVTVNGSLLVPYYDGFKEVKPVYAVESFMRSLKSRGYHITVHSHNGWEWALNVVNALGLENIVDRVQTKPSKCIDDATDFIHIYGTLIHPDVLK